MTHGSINATPVMYIDSGGLVSSQPFVSAYIMHVDFRYLFGCDVNNYSTHALLHNFQVGFMLFLCKHNVPVCHSHDHCHL